MENVNRYVVGVLGGMGSYSTLHFFEALIDAFSVEKEWERPRIVIDNHCTLPSRTRAILYDERRAELVDGMARSIEGLLAYEPDVICMPCNTAHCFLPEVRESLAGRNDRVLDMIDVVAQACSEEGASEVFLLATEGTVATGVYQRYCARRGVRVQHPDDAQLGAIRGYIEQVKQKRDLDPAGFTTFLDGLGADTVILGCTELSVLYDGAARVRVLDPIAMVVERVRAAAESTGAAHAEPR